MLADTGIIATCEPPNVDEDAIAADDPLALALARAIAKAEDVHRSGQCTIAADQVAHLDGVAFGKPLDPADHRARLRALRGRTHTLTTALVVMHDETITRLNHSLVTFRADLSDEELDEYVAMGEGSGCAGGYRAEGRGAQLISRIEGDWWNVIGLPLYDLVGLLRAGGWRPIFS